jgi:hypothetical protein
MQPSSRSTNRESRIIHLDRPRARRQHAGQLAAYQQQEFARWKVIDTRKITIE